MSTKLAVISGFLGAGKTTFINKILSAFDPQKGIAIIENEYGEVNVDADLIQSSGVQIKEMNQGCICCSLFGDFVSGLMSLVDSYAPERIIVEPTGVGMLSDILDACHVVAKLRPFEIDMLVTIVDGVNYHFNSGMFCAFFGNQIATASTIVISRTQELSEGERETVCIDLRRRNPNAMIVAAPWDDLSASDFVELCQSVSVLNKYQHPEERNQHDHQLDHQHHYNGLDLIGSWSWQQADTMTKEEFEERFARSIADDLCGKIVRAKGFIVVGKNERIQFDYVTGKLLVRDFAQETDGRLVFIGNALNRDRLLTIWQQ